YLFLARMAAIWTLRTVAIQVTYPGSDPPDPTSPHRKPTDTPARHHDESQGQEGRGHPTAVYHRRPGALPGKGIRPDLDEPGGPACRGQSCQPLPSFPEQAGSHVGAHAGDRTRDPGTDPGGVRPAGAHDGVRYGLVGGHGDAVA